MRYKAQLRHCRESVLGLKPISVRKKNQDRLCFVDLAKLDELACVPEIIIGGAAVILPARRDRARLVIILERLLPLADSIEKLARFQVALRLCRGVAQNEEQLACGHKIVRTQLMLLDTRAQI